MNAHHIPARPDGPAAPATHAGHTVGRFAWEGRHLKPETARIPRRAHLAAIRGFVPWPRLGALALLPIGRHLFRKGLTCFGFSPWDIEALTGFSLLGLALAAYAVAFWMLVLQARIAKGSIDERARHAACLLAGLLWMASIWQAGGWLVRFGPYVLRQASAAAEERAHPAFTLSADGRELAIRTEFVWGVTRRAKELVKANPGIRTLTLSGPGGMALEGTELARFVLARGLDTRVVTRCSSACAIVFLAGRRRTLGAGEALLGFHAVHVSREGGAVRAWDDDVDEVLRRSGASQAFLWRVWETPPETLWHPGPAELAAGGVPVEIEPALKR